MYTTDEKRALVNKMLDNNNNYNKKHFLGILKDCLFQDTNGTLRLYKYKTVTPYTLKSIIDNTLYCANPSSFNDPFDCYIGASIWSLYAEKLNFELEGEVNVIVDFFKKVVRCNNKSKHKNKLKKYQRHVFDEIKSDENLWDFITQFNDESNTREKMHLIQTNKWSIRTIIKHMIKQDEFKKQLPFIAKNYEIMFVEHDKVKDCNKVDEKQYVIEWFEQHNPKKLEIIIDVFSIMESIVKEINQGIDNSMRVGCLCTSKNDIRMWSYYTNGHQGICIEYDYSNSNATDSNFPMPVIYSENRPQMPWRFVIKNTSENQDKDNLALAIGLLYKGKAWEEEKEWRIIIGNKQNQNIPMPPIKCIYLGAKISEVDKALVLHIAKNRGIPVKQMVLDKSCFFLHEQTVT